MTDTLVPPTGPGPVRRPREDAPREDASRDGREDPRLARRRQGVQDAARHRRNRLLLAGVAVALVLVGGVLVTRSPLLDVDHVVVTGSSPVARADVVRAAGVGTGDPLVGVDATAVRDRVMALAGVASARVTVEWPDTVRIVVTPERPLARVQVGATAVVVARGGRVLSRAAGDTPGLPVLTAGAVPAGSLRVGHEVPQVLGDALVVLEQLPASLRPLLASAALGADGSLTFALPDDGGTVRFGPPEDIPAKVLAAASMLGGQVQTACLDVLDLREPTRPTISRRPGCAVPAPTVAAPTTTTPRSTPTTTPRSTTTNPRSTPTTTPRSTPSTVLRSTTTALRSTTTTAPRPTTTGPRRGG